MRNGKLIGVNVSEQERDYVEHAAKLRGLSLQQYVKRAINEALQRDGVDALLLKLRERPR